MFIVGSVALLLWGCSPDTQHSDQHTSHQDVPIDSSVQLLTKPTNQHVVAKMQVIKAEQGLKVFPVKITGRITYDSKNNTSISSRVGGRIERLWIKYNYQPIKKGQLIMEIYSPELAAAQRELLMLSNAKDDHLLTSAIQKLRYLGMNNQQIQQVLKTNTPLYRVPLYSPVSGYIIEKAGDGLPSVATAAGSSIAPGSGDAMTDMGGSNTSSPNPPASRTESNQPILLREGQYVSVGQSLFTIYTNTDLVGEFAIPPHWAKKIQKGKKIIFQSTDDLAKTYQAEIGLIQPSFNAGGSFSLARIYLKDVRLPIGQLLNGTIAITERKGFWLPQQAVVLLGTKSVLFKKEGSTFRPINIQTGARTNTMVQVLSSIENWQIAKNASYLVDSEGFITADKVE